MTATSALAPQPSQLRVLHVEDDPLDAELAAEALRKGGFAASVAIAQTEAEFKQHLRSHNPDIVIADYSLPHWNGMEALEVLRRECPDIPLILVSGSLRDELHSWRLGMSAVPAWVLVIVGIVTAAFICLQSWETRKAAQAATLNAKTLINAERPWVMVQIKEAPVEKGHGVFDLRSFQFTIFNYGKSPAHILSCKGPKIEFYVAPDKNLPIPPDYGTWEWERKFLAPNDSLPISKTIYPSKIRMEMISEAEVKGEHANTGELVAYGLIEYTDGISETAYKTAFCYRHEKFPLSSMGGHFLLCGPRVYNLHA